MRIEIRVLIIEGKIGESIAEINKNFPGIFEENKQLAIQLHAFQFIEFLRANDTTQAINYAQQHLNCFQNENVIVFTEKEEAQLIPLDVIFSPNALMF